MFIFTDYRKCCAHDRIFLVTLVKEWLLFVKYLIQMVFSFDVSLTLCFVVMELYFGVKKKNGILFACG